MSQSQNVIYYTTAQVTDMVELSDQNVRKYVRLLEDRNYEVAKDEHNRRLFSKKDVSVLQEMIKIAKSPGNTLDSAADEIIENMDDFEEMPSENQISKMSDSDVSRLLALVLEKLDEIQNENKELKSNISTLVHRLEEYDLKALEYNPVEKVETSIAEDTTEDASEETGMEETVTPETTEEEIVVEAPAEEEEAVEEETVEEEPAEEAEEAVAEEDAAEEETAVETEETAEKSVETEKQNTGTIDLSAQEEKVTSEPAEEVNTEDTAKQQIEEPKKGFFGKLASMFKG
ncbi:hypothetical protein BN1048_01401 [Jeotgalicoccus saudimassiliensis]|uniref:HTH merR-type domain-containing protein n=1 Tax=Jeotgalicoccus saudimassiliensis TaxID=1461582 RepID=A0A078M2D1_9STAP|nr:hypothetical protein [Jeotgalicoccus saudimassiliensis]CEA01528.1 hypothetical protein BN1048_01401 [Jeotgalicoccus saudimassiliensis]